ncbi:hypothetical protein IWX50DRAFT_616679 [Phyllosticta citricarpa]|uniref:Uncharacterized protein n=1 Tax=Phyllosticta citricarpa TaxID=55181 RepID=A0ABR1MP23_9PEZI
MTAPSFKKRHATAVLTGISHTPARCLHSGAFVSLDRWTACKYGYGDKARHGKASKQASKRATNQWACCCGGSSSLTLPLPLPPPPLSSHSGLSSATRTSAPVRHAQNKMMYACVRVYIAVHARTYVLKKEGKKNKKKEKNYACDKAELDGWGRIGCMGSGRGEALISSNDSSTLD